MENEHELNFLLVRDSSGDWPRWKRAALGSAVFHLFAITTLFLVKGSTYEPPPPERVFVPHVTHLYIPKDLTQKAPNKGPVAPIMMAASAPSPAPKVVAPPPVKAPELPKAAPPAAPPVQQPVPAPVIQPPAAAPTEAPRIQAPVQAPPTVARTEPPKLETPVPPVAPKQNPILNTSPNSIQDMMRSIAKNGAPISAPPVTETYDMGGSARLSSPQLKSDPMGTDFKPYMRQVLQAVRTNWLAVYPEAARLGQHGVVVLELAISREGGVVKVVFSRQTGAKALDQAAVAAISASNPLPPLPKDYKGEQIVLDMSFMYNMPK